MPQEILGKSKWEKWGYDIEARHEIGETLTGPWGGQFTPRWAYVKINKGGKLIADIYADFEKLEKDRDGVVTDGPRVLDPEATEGLQKELSDLAYWALERHLKNHNIEGIRTRGTIDPDNAQFLEEHRGWKKQPFSFIEGKPAAHQRAYRAYKLLSGRVHEPKRWSNPKTHRGK